MLKGERGNPKVVGGDRGALRSELAVDSGVVVRRLFVGEEHVDPRPHQETTKGPLILRPL